MMNGADMNGWGWVGMTLMALLAIAIVGLVVWAIARRPGEAHPRAKREQLDERLARGAIAAEQYRERLKTLTRPPTRR